MYIVIVRRKFCWFARSRDTERVTYEEEEETRLSQGHQNTGLIYPAAAKKYN